MRFERRCAEAPRHVRRPVAKELWRVKMPNWKRIQEQFALYQSVREDVLSPAMIDDIVGLVLAHDFLSGGPRRRRRRRRLRRRSSAREGGIGWVDWVARWCILTSASRAAPSSRGPGRGCG